MADVFAGTLALIVVIVLFSIAGIVGLAMLGSRSDVHRVSGDLRHEHSGTIRHEVTGTVQHTVQHVGTVQHEHEHMHRLDPRDAARLDRLAEQRELEEAERARLEF